MPHATSERELCVDREYQLLQDTDKTEALSDSSLTPAVVASS